MIYISLIFEDELSESVMNRLLQNFNKYEVVNSYSGHGYGYLKNNIRGFNQASAITPHFMLTDLDNYSCPIELINDWITFDLNKNFIFRIAVKEVESWLLADVEGLSRYFNVSAVNFPKQPDLEDDPKNTLIQLARRSRKRNIREDIVPINNFASIGPNYNGCLSNFVYHHWNIERAVLHSKSLERAYRKLSEFKF